MVTIEGVNLILMWIPLSEGSSYITSHNATWNEAINNCSMETPLINYSGSKKHLSVAFDLAGSDVWVGYYLSSTAFHYIGCMEVGERTETAKFAYNNPGLCYSACMKKNLIGISQTKCYCLKDIMHSNISKTTCDKGCKDHTDIACGGEKEMSIYIIESAAQSYSGNGECLLFETNTEGAKLKWSNCTNDHNAICVFGNDIVQDALDKTGKKQYQNWRNSMNICLRLRRLPSSLKQLEEHKSETPSWAGVITSVVIYSIEGTSNTDSTEVSEGSDVGVTVGVSFAVIITMVVIVAIVIFIYTRRGKLPSLCYRKAPSEKTVAHTQPTSAINNNANEIPSESAYNQIDEVALQRNLDGTKGSHQNTSNVVQEDNGTYAHTYLDLENLETITEKDITVSEKEESNNVYNTLNANLEVECNTENAYDTTGKAERKLKGQQDNDIQDEERNAFGYIDNVDYNHTNDIPVKNKRTDNVYSVPDANERDYGDVRRSSGNDLGEGDPYNHIEIKNKC